MVSMHSAALSHSASISTRRVADGVDGLWSSAPEVVARYVARPIIDCAIDAVVAFHWTAPWHDVVRVADAGAYERCDFGGAVTLSPAAPYAGTPYEGSTAAAYYFECTEELAGQTVFVSCSIGQHCASGQKVAIRVSESVRAVDAGGSPPTPSH